MQTTKIGDKGEQLAAEALVRLGHEILQRNWKTKWCEVDIVTKKDGVVCFIEVKYRATAKQGDGFDYITDQKLHHMQRAAELWVSVHNWNGEYNLLVASVSGVDSDVDIREVI